MSYLSAFLLSLATACYPPHSCQCCISGFVDDLSWIQRLDESLSLTWTTVRLIARRRRENALTKSVPETKSRGVGRNGGGGGGSRVFSSHIGGSRSTAFRQTIGADDTEGTNRGSKKRKQPASTDDDEEEEEEEQALERRQPILTSREQPAGIDVGMSGSGKGRNCY